MQQRSGILPIAGVLSGALVWGLIWYPYRILQEAGVSGAFAVLLSNGLAMLFGIYWLPRVWRELPQAKGWAILLIVSAGWADFAYVLAMLHGDVMRVLLLFYLAPLWTILFSYFLLGERLNRCGYLIMLLSFSGAMVMLWRPTQGIPLPQNLSEWLSVSAGMGLALSNVVSLRTAQLSVEAKAYSILIGAVLLTVPLLYWQGGVTKQWQVIEFSHIAILLLLGLSLLAISFTVQFGVSTLPASQTILLFLFELVAAAIASYFLANEMWVWRDVMGALLIVSATLMSGKLHAPVSVQIQHDQSDY